MTACWLQVLLEFKEYATEVDVDFVRRSVRAIGRCAISLERAAERCINVLLELIQTKVNYVVQEAIIVIKDIFRRYPNRSGHELQFQTDYFVWQAASQGLSSTTQCPSTNPSIVLGQADIPADDKRHKRRVCAVEMCVIHKHTPGAAKEIAHLLFLLHTATIS